MEACHVKRGQGSCISIPQIHVGKLAYQNCSRDKLSPRGGWELHRPQWRSHTFEIFHKICEADCACPSDYLRAEANTPFAASARLASSRLSYTPSSIGGSSGAAPVWNRNTA